VLIGWILVLRFITSVIVVLEFCRGVVAFYHAEIHAFIDLLEEES